MGSFCSVFFVKYKGFAMKMNKLNLIRIAALLAVFGAFGVTRAAALSAYGSPCGDPSGLPGLLVKMHFIPKATCPTSNGTTCSNLNADCNANTLSGKQIAGKCVQVGSLCSCKAI
jgi:hypothetical protein